MGGCLRWATCGAFLRWCKKHGHVKVNPAAELDAEDKPWCGRVARRQMGRGKPTLRNAGEAAAYLQAAATLETAEDRVGAVLPLLLGLASGEVRHLQVGDVDVAASCLWIRDDEAELSTAQVWDVKEASRRRAADLPPSIAADLLSLCQGQPATAYVFRSVRNKAHRGGPYGEDWLWRLVHRVCALAGTRIVCPHGLRDTYSTILAAKARIRAPDIAALLGHADTGRTALRHYIGQRPQVAALELQPHTIKGD